MHAIVATPGHGRLSDFIFGPTAKVDEKICVLQYSEHKINFRLANDSLTVDYEKAQLVNI